MFSQPYPSSDIYPKEMNSVPPRDNLHSPVQWSITDSSQDMEPPLSINRGINCDPTHTQRENTYTWGVYLHTVEYYSDLKKETLPFAMTWINPEGIMLSKISHTHKGKKNPCISLICGIQKCQIHRGRVGYVE